MPPARTAPKEEAASAASEEAAGTAEAAPAVGAGAARPRDGARETKMEDVKEEPAAASDGKWEVRPAPESTLVTVVLHGLYDNRLVDLNEWPSFYEDMREDVEKECGRHGEVLRCFMERREPRGSLWLCFSTPTQAQACFRAMNHRYYAGRRVTAEIHSSDIWFAMDS